MRLILAILLCLSVGSAKGQTVTLDSGLQRYFAPIKDTTLTPSMPPATRFYCFVTTDLLYGSCSIFWQLSYSEEGVTYTLTSGQVQMSGDAYLAYSLNNRSVADLFTYAGAAIGVTFIP